MSQKKLKKILEAAMDDVAAQLEALHQNQQNENVTSLHGELVRLGGELALLREEIVSQADRRRAAENEKSSQLSGEVSLLRDQIALRDEKLRDARAYLEICRVAIQRTAREVHSAYRKQEATLSHLKQSQRTIAAEIGQLAAYAFPVTSRQPNVSWLVRLLAPRNSPVRLSLGALVTRGDQENAKKAWAEAAMYYGLALQRDSTLSAIWIQYGHALKELRLLGLAEIAYRTAVRVDATSVDGFVQLGHLLDRLGRKAEAFETFQEARRLSPSFAWPSGIEGQESHADSFSSVASIEARIDESFRGVMDRLVQPSEANGLVRRGVIQVADAIALDASWPPDPVDNYWLPQKMRDYLVDAFSDEIVPTFQYFFSVVNAYGPGGRPFDRSVEADLLVSRASYLSEQRVCDDPEVSIVMPAYNNAALTLTSLVSVLEFAGRSTFEIIVGDNQSEDETPVLVGQIGGVVTLVRHGENLGFLKNCNTTAKLCRGKYVVLLNNDTLALPGWLDELIEPLRSDADVHLTGSKLLNADGSLQEAGGIFWRDGSAWNFGRNQDPRLPAFNYRKPADYISGASIALPLQEWRRLGGFDLRYVPAYCEDSDLAFRVRERGGKVIYTPHSEIIHHEGAAHGRDVSSGVKSYQVVNTRKLLERWKAVLEAEHFENGTNVVMARDRSRAKPHVLIVDHYVPEWDRDAGSRTIYLYAKLFLDAGFQVSLWPDNLYKTPRYAKALQKLGVEVIYSAEYVGRFDAWLEERADVLNYVFLSRPHVSIKYLPVIKRHPGIRTLYYGHDLHFARMERQNDVALNSVSKEEIEKTRELELEVCKACDVVFYPSSTEIDYVEKAIPGVKASEFAISFFDQETLAIAGRRLESGGSKVRGAMKQLLFVGGFAHTPNVDAMIWFVESVMPVLRTRGLSVRLDIVGSNPPDSIKNLAGSDIIVHGYVGDDALADFYGKADVVVVPLRYGAGVKGKVIEAMAAGVPIVMTSIGAQGIDGAEQLSFVEDSATGFASSIEEVLGSEGSASQKARRALEFVDRRYSANAIMERMSEFVPELVGPRKR